MKMENTNTDKITNKDKLKQIVTQGLINSINPFFLTKEFIGNTKLLEKLNIFTMNKGVNIDKYIVRLFGDKDNKSININRSLFGFMFIGLNVLHITQTYLNLPFRFIHFERLNLNSHILLIFISYSAYFLVKEALCLREIEHHKKDDVKELFQEENNIVLKRMYKLGDYIDTVNIKKKKLPFMLGVDKNGKVIIGDYFEMKNVLIAGLPGGGKSVMVNSFIQSLMYFNGNISFVLVDFKTVELCYYEDFDNVTFIEKLTEFDNILDKLLAEMEKRYQAMRRKATNISQMDSKEYPFIMLVIDEVSEIKLNSINDKDSENIEKKVIRLQNKGRAAGIFTLIATQKPDSKQLNPNIKSNANVIMSCKISNKVTQNIVGVKGTETLSKGEFKTVLEGEEEGQIYKGFFLDMSETRPKDHITFTKLKKIKEKTGGVILEKTYN
jgi:hypothetical protein